MNDPKQMQTDNPSAPDYDWQADREWFNHRLANARIHNSELEQKLAAALHRISSLERVCAKWAERYEAAALCIGHLEAVLQLVNDKHGPILEASVHEAVLACLGLKVHPNGTGYGYVPSGPSVSTTNLKLDVSSALGLTGSTDAKACESK